MAKFKYRMQNILDIKMKLETQARNEYGIANQRYLEEEEVLQQLILKRVSYETRLRNLMEGDIDVDAIRIARSDVNSMKAIVRKQMVEVHKAEKALEDARIALTEVMAERKTHEKLKERAFDQFQAELKAEESKEIDELVSFTYNLK